ncbi:MAG: Franean1_4349 family RiPP [Chloroflexia bacterium]|nr:Franean1_4349 family RiPP [Chloroflexia bacterium]
MSHEAVAIIIGRALTDSEFRQKLIDDAAAACQGYDLTAEELAALEAIEPENLETFAGSLPERLIKGVGGGFIGD